MLIRIIILCAFIVSSSYGQFQIFDFKINLNFKLGLCQKMKLQPNFDMQKFAGKWYEWGKTPNPDQDNAKCDIVNYIAFKNSNMTISNTNLVGSDSLQYTNTGTLTFGEGAPDADLRIVYPTNAFGLPYEYQILSTDYTNYAVVTACRNNVLVHTRNIWALTRLKFPFQSTIDAINGVLDENGIDKSPGAFTQTDQFFCPQFW